MTANQIEDGPDTIDLEGPCCKFTPMVIVRTGWGVVVHALGAVTVECFGFIKRVYLELFRFEANVNIYSEYST